jgi:hypothetical protein
LEERVIGMKNFEEGLLGLENIWNFNELTKLELADAVIVLTDFT